MTKRAQPQPRILTPAYLPVHQSCPYATILVPSVYTIGWIAALDIEQAAARALLDEEHCEPNNFHPSPSDTNNYIWGRVGQHNIVIASLPAGVYGTTSAATTASDLVHSLPQIRFGLLVGIGGAIARPNDDQDIRLGDVVVGQPHGVTGGVVQYDFGKALDKPPAVLLKALANLQAEHEIRPSKIPRLVEAMLKANPGMKRPGSNFTYQGSENDRLFPSDYEHVGGKTCAKCDVSREICREERETTEPMIHCGFIASGNTFIKDAAFRDSLAESIGHQCLCVEMEAVGLVDKLPCLVIRGICDYADSHKNDQWQRYAASTAAAFAVELLGYVPERQLKESPRVLEILQSLECKVDFMSRRMQQTYLTSTLDQLPFVAEALFNSYAEEHSPMCPRETRAQLLTEIDEWVTRAESKTIFWLNGMAGTGKSTISRTVAQRQLERDCLGANFFFKRGEASRGNMSKLIPTLARQLAMHIPGMVSLVKKAIDGDPSLPKKTVSEQFEKLLKEPLEKLAASSSDPTSLVFVIDALDECEGKFHIKRLLSLFAELECLDPLKLRVFLTSRPELPIQLGFLDVNGMYQSLELHSISQDIMEHDISIFLHHEIGIIRKNFNFVVRNEQRLSEQWPPGTVKIEHLVSKTQPLFIAAATVCRFLNDATLGSPDELLVRILDSSSRTHMSRLDDIYSSILASQVVNRPRRELEEIVKSFQSIVGAIVTLATPQTINSLSLLLSIPAMTIDMRIKVLQSVLDVLKAPEVAIRILHLSFRDYLVDPDLRGATDFWVDEKATHRRLASRCLYVMDSILRENICRLPFPGTSPSFLDPHKFVPAELHYACHYWSVVFSQDSKILASSSTGGTVRIWNLQTGDCDEVLKYPSPTGKAFAFSRDSNVLLTASGNQFVRIWKTQTWDHFILKRHTGAVNSAVISHDSKMVLRGHDCDVLSAVFSPDSRMIASGDAEGRIGIWDARSGAFLHELKNSYNGGFKSLMFSEDATKLIAVLSTRTALILDIQSKNCEQAFNFSSSSLNWSVELSHDLTMILTTSSDDITVRIWDPESAKSWNKKILEVEISPNGIAVVLDTVFGHEIWSLGRNAFECLLVRGKPTAACEGQRLHPVLA
ncbi:Vegetative incompatibility HET-E-1 [Fusarium agapanthi]|uniref:Vegetative incompatibility HET-E-1 n=1 Tax=Fusarium agapanthi TaxID=1803897 RepID=A0A9P5BEB6_9HYPO|nr:Vegetative incompatibility HET-E-1 [Fusarium agapanthi]